MVEEKDAGVERRESGQLGETPDSNKVVSDIAGIQQALGDKFNIEEAIKFTKFNELKTGEEKAWAQWRLRKELGIELPAELQVTESELEKVRPRVPKAQKDRPKAVEAAEMTLEDRIAGFAELIRGDYERAERLDQKVYLEQLLELYLDDGARQQLGDEGLRQLREMLKDIPEEPAEEGAPTAPAEARVPEKVEGPPKVEPTPTAPVVEGAPTPEEPRVGLRGEDYKAQLQQQFLREGSAVLENLKERIPKLTSEEQRTIAEQFLSEKTAELKKLEEAKLKEAAKAKEAAEKLNKRNEAAEATRDLKGLERKLAAAEQEVKETDKWWRGGAHEKAKIVRDAAKEDVGKAEQALSKKVEAAATASGQRVDELRGELEQDFATAEKRPGLLDQPPGPESGEPDEKYLTRLERWKDAAESGVKAVPKFVWGVATTLLGVRLAQTSIQFFKERVELRREKKAVAEMVRELEQAQLQAKPEAEKTPEVEQKADKLRERLESLKRDRRLSDTDAKALEERLGEVLVERAKREESARDDLEKEVARILEDHLKAKISKIELGRQALNTAFLLTGLQSARAISYGGLTLLQRAARAREKYEQGVRAERLTAGGEGRKSKFWEREKAISKDLTLEASKDYLKGISGAVADLISGERVSKGEWARKKMEFNKALGTTFVFAGLAKVAAAEMSEPGFSFSSQIDRALDKIEKQGLAGAIGNNWLKNIDQLSFGLTHFAKDGALETASDPRQGLGEPKHAAPAEAVKSPEELQKEAEARFFEKHPEWQRLEAASGGKIDVQGQADGHIKVEVNLGARSAEWHAELQRALRDISVAELPIAGKAFTTIDGAHVENTVGNATALLDGNDLRFIDAEKLDGVAHVAAGKLIIDDYAKFHEFLQQTLFKHSQEMITPQTLESHSGVVAVVNNTSDANWQHDVNVKTGVEAPAAAGHVAVKLDHELIDKAEIAEAQHAASDLGIEGASAPEGLVKDENNFTIEIGNQSVPVLNGEASIVATTIGETTYTDKLEEHIKINDPYAGHHLREALSKAKQAHEAAIAEAPAPEAAAEAGALLKEDIIEKQVAQLPGMLQSAGGQYLESYAEPGKLEIEFKFVGPDGLQHSGAIISGKLMYLDENKLSEERQAAIQDVGAKLPELLRQIPAKDFHGLLKPADYGGIIATDGKIHVGAQTFERGWLESAEKQSVDSFIKAPPKPWWDLMGATKEARAYAALAEAMKAHPDAKAPDVGDYIFKHLKELPTWIKPAPRVEVPGI